MRYASHCLYVGKKVIFYYMSIAINKCYFAVSEYLYLKNTLSKVYCHYFSLMISITMYTRLATNVYLTFLTFRPRTCKSKTASEDGKGTTTTKNAKASTEFRREEERQYIFH